MHYIVVDDRFINLDRVDIIAPLIDELKIEFAFNEGVTQIQFNDLGSLIEAMKQINNTVQPTPVDGKIVEPSSTENII